MRTSPSRPARRVLVAVLSLVAALVAAACSSAPKHTDTGSTSTTAASSGATTTTGATSTSGATSTTAAKATTTPPKTAATTKPGTSTTAAAAGAQGTWTTYFHDSGRSGVANDGPANPAAVHRLWTSPTLDGEMYAQPLLAGNLVIEATENDTVYALSVTTGTVVWSTHLGSPVPSSTLPCGDVDPVVGITGTPVVDVATNRVFAVGLVQPTRDVLFELNLATGALVASVGVDPPGSSPATDNQRGALALDGNSILVPYGGRDGDCGSYHGRVTSVPMAGAGLGSPSYFTLPTQNEGGFWAPPGPVIASDGSIYLTSGNSSSSGTFDYGNAVVHLSAGLQLLDYFAPSNWVSLNSSDLDLGSTSPVLVGSQVFQVGKSGVGYLLNASHLGGVGGQLASASVCPELAYGGVSHIGTSLFVPCPNYLAGVSVAGSKVTVAWMASASAPGPAIITPGAVWSIATGSGQLDAFSVSTGKLLWSQSIGSVPSRFTSPAAGLNRVVVAAGSQIIAFGE